MAVTATRYVDPQGRLILPAHIREAMNIGTGRVVEMTLEDDNTVRLRASEARCHLCGNSVEEKPHMASLFGSDRKNICRSCAERIVVFVDGGGLNDPNS